MDILKYGPGVEVLRPKKLRKAVAGKLREAGRQYKKIISLSGFDRAGVV